MLLHVHFYLLHCVGSSHPLQFQYDLPTVPAPTSVIVPPLMSTTIAGSSPNLTCTVELSPAVDVPVTVTTVWTGPVGTTVTPTSSVMESLTRYTIMAMVDAARNGDYTCQVTLSSSSQFITDSGMTSGMTTITVGEYQVLAHDCMLYT